MHETTPPGLQSRAIRTNHRHKNTSNFNQVLMVVALIMVSLPVVGRGDDFLRYRNDRYGFWVEYPAECRADPPPANGDGRTFRDTKGFQCSISGINNVLAETVVGEMQSQRADFEKITYEAKGRNWFVLSGYSGSEIVYRKTFVGKGSSNHLFISYPAARKAEYAAKVERIARSFKPGDLTVAH